MKPKKLVFWLSLAVLFLFLIVPIIGNTLPLELSDDSLKSRFEEIRLFAVPIAILLTLSGTLKRKDDKGKNILIIVSTVMIAVLSLLGLFASVFMDMCAWNDRKILFVNDSGEKIILRDYGCGAVDSGSPIYNTVKIKRIAPGLNRVTDVDTSKIDKKIWLRNVTPLSKE
jgi:hypothetical protein